MSLSESVLEFPSLVGRCGKKKCVNTNKRLRCCRCGELKATNKHRYERFAAGGRLGSYVCRRCR